MVLNDADDAPETAIRSAHGYAAVPYQRRRPEETTLYQVVQEHVETFVAQVELETGAGLPQFVKDEFEAFLECGIWAHGFLRLRRGTCAQDNLVAFSCKRRGFCPACEDACLPACPKCVSADTAAVQVGVVGRTISIVAATTKVKLVPNKRFGRCFCNECKEFFD